MRLLPPTIPEVEFLSTVPTDLVDWHAFVPGRRLPAPTPEQPNLNARCYLNFKSFSHASNFIQKFHGQVFMDDKGESFRAVACLAPYQRVPRKSVPNSLDNTYETDQHYLDFLQGLNSKAVTAAPQPKEEKQKGYVSPLVKSMMKVSGKKVPVPVKEERSVPSQISTKKVTPVGVSAEAKPTKKVSTDKKATKVGTPQAQKVKSVQTPIVITTQASKANTAQASKVSNAQASKMSNAQAPKVDTALASLDPKPSQKRASRKKTEKPQPTPESPNDFPRFESKVPPPPPPPNTLTKPNGQKPKFTVLKREEPS